MVGARLVQMAADDEDELLRKVRAQNRSVSFVTGSELVNIDLGDDSYRRNEDSELNETVRFVKNTIDLQVPVESF